MSYSEQNKKKDQLLQSLDGIERAAAPDFFYARLKARMASLGAANEKQAFLLRPAFLLTGTVLVCLLNVFFISNSRYQQQSRGYQNMDGISSFASEYNISGGTDLDINY